MAMRPGETPVPIPNTMVKARAADGTALETMWESRWLPDFKKEKGIEGTGKEPGFVCDERIEGSGGRCCREGFRTLMTDKRSAMYLENRIEVKKR